MMVGKRGTDCKNPVRRTTSMTEFAPPGVLASVVEDEEEARTAGQPGDGRQDWLAAFGGGAAGAEGGDWLAAYRARTAPARAGLLRRNSADYSAAETAAFLRACGLCRRRLGPGRDTFMYKGEAAFCSLECRERHIAQEEWTEKRAVNEAPRRSRKPGTGGGTVAAA